MIVDEMHEEHPELLKDQYWDEVVPKDLPYTVASEQYRREEPKGSAEHYKVKDSDALYANVFLGTHVHGGHGGAHRPGKAGHMQDDVYADYVSARAPSFKRIFSLSLSLSSLGAALYPVPVYPYMRVCIGR